MEFTKVIKERFSTRKFSNKQIEKEKLNNILEAARIAPTAKNLQSFKILVIESEEGLKKVDKASNCRFNAPTVIIVCGDKDNSYSHFDHSFIDIDTSIVTTHMMLAATNEGIDSIWIGLFDPDIIKEEFNLPANYTPITMLPLGYREEGVKPSHLHDKRKQIEELVEYR